MPEKKRKANGRQGKPLAVLDQLKPAEAQIVLVRLLAAHPYLVAEAEQTAKALLQEGQPHLASVPLIGVAYEEAASKG